MSRLKYSIAGINIELNSDNNIFENEHFKPFRCESDAVDYIAEFIKVKGLSVISGKVVESNIDFQVIESRDDTRYKYYRLFCDGRTGINYAISFWDGNDKKIKIEYIAYGETFVNETKNTILHLGLEALLLRKNRIILHGAFVRTEFGGLIFTGPSGIGKSTQAGLWEVYKKAELLNGDRTIISVNDEIFAWGSPYAGSSKCYKNEKCDICAIIKIVQADENKVERLSVSEAFTVLYPETIVNDWSRQDVELTFELLRKITENIPVYKLYCTPDKRAVDALENVLKGE